jgi:hypothetical protein
MPLEASYWKQMESKVRARPPSTGALLGGPGPLRLSLGLCGICLHAIDGRRQA